VSAVATGRATEAGEVKGEKLDQGVTQWPSRLSGVCDGVATHPVKQEVLPTSVKRICRIGKTGIESGIEERLRIGIRNVQGLKTKYDEISKELEGNNLDITVLTETKEKSYRK
jgi:hypothetical protein